MLKKILITLGVLSTGILAVYAATSSSQYVYYGPNSVPQNTNNTQTTFQTPAKPKSEYPTFNYSQADEPVITTTVGQLPEGSYILDKDSLWKFRADVNYSGKILAEVPVVWQKIEDNHFQPNTTLLLSKYDVALTSWTWKYGLEYYTAWDNSRVRDFLRTTFYNHLSQKFKNAIVEVDIPYIDLKGNIQSIKDNLFLLSVAEWGLAKSADPKNKTNYANEGKPILYHGLSDTYSADTMRGYECTWLDNKIFNLYDNNGTYHYPTRTIFKNSVGYGANTLGINGNGYIQSAEVFNTRPAVNITSSTVVKGPYIFKYYSHCDANAKTRKFYEIVE